MPDRWDDEAGDPEAQAATIVARLIALSNNDEACRLLGVDGTLEDELDVTFLNDPLAWIASEVANSIRLEEDESEGVSLSTVVALLRLYRVLRGGALDEAELREAVRGYLREDEDES